MTNRALGVTMLVVGVALLGVQVSVKPAANPEAVQQLANLGTQSRQWLGRVAPDIEVPTLDNSTFHLAEHVGRDVIILNFFATWCGPCREEMPELQEYIERQAGRRVMLVAIDVNEKRPTVETFVKDQRLRLRVGLDESGEIGKRYGVSAYPTTVVVGADGRVAYYEAAAINNADIALGLVVRTQMQVLAGNGGITRADYEAALAKEPKGSTAAATSSEPVLTGRALRIAQSMPCPCGCDQKVHECTCQTAKAIKVRLAAGGYDAKSDADVMRELNREFCMKGM